MVFEIPKGNDIADGTYPATLLSVEPNVTSFGEGRRWNWLVDVNGEMVDHSSLSSLHLGPQSKAYKWLTALNGGVPPKAGEQVDPIGKRVLLTFSHNEKGFPAIANAAPFVEAQQTVPGIPR
jgi:hypothetical protein